MTRESRIVEVQDLAKRVNREIPVKRYIRQRIVQEEIIDAYISPVPTAVVVEGKTKMVEMGDWVVIREDGLQDTYKAMEFAKIFEAYIEEQKPNPKPNKDDRRN